MFSNILSGAAGFPVADLGDEISQSLRFRGAQNLKRTLSSPTNQNNWTVSLWMKRSKVTARGDFFDNSSGTSNSTLFEMFFNGSGTLGFSKMSIAQASTATFRDTAAWYHIVITNDGSDIEGYINNVKVNTWTGQGGATSINTAAEHCIGSENFHTGDGLFTDGYMAEFNFLDGTVLDPDSFGRPNEDGVWVPKSLSGLTAAQYGNNGFRLTFDSSQNNAGIGEDSAPIGASGHTARNDFTPSGFDTTSLSQRSHQVFGDNTSAYNTNNTNKIFLAPPDASQSFGPSRMFDGDLVNNQCKSGTGTAQTWIYYRPDPALSVNSSLGITCSQTQAIRVNGVDQNLSNTSASTLNVSNPPASVTEIAIQGNTISSATVFGITVDGTVLTDNLANDIDYKDTPTNNFSTYNALVNNDEPTFNQGNLDGDSFNNGIAWASQELPNEHLYCEFVKTAGDHFAAGVWDAEDKFEKGSNSDNDYAFGIVYSEFADQYRIFNENTTATQTGLARYYTGGVLGVEWRGDLATRQVNFYIDGTQVGSSENVAAGGRYYFGAHRAGGSTPASVEVNFGQRPFIAAPTGVSNTTHGMQTNKLPEPTIKNGKKHFEAITWPGNDIDDRAITTTEGFAPALVWIKCIDSVINHFIYDTVRGAPNRLFPNLTNDEDTGAGHLKSFTSTGFTLGTSGNVNGTGNNYVAWCWSAPDTWASTDADVTAGTIASSGRRNKDAGFSIVSYTGDNDGAGTFDTIAHGLQDSSGAVTPDLIIVKGRNFVDEWHVKHVDMNNADSIRLNISTVGANFNAWNNTAPNSDVFTVGPINGTNKNGAPFIAYCWKSIEGYSKFGSYTANGSTDGPFVYLGFKPQLVITKTISGVNDSWTIWDSTRGPTNPNKFTLVADGDARDVLTGNDIDFLSNGFKLRNALGNQSGGQYVYMAWAENPFGGENAPPATAR